MLTIENYPEAYLSELEDVINEFLWWPATRDTIQMMEAAICQAQNNFIAEHLDFTILDPPRIIMDANGVDFTIIAPLHTQQEKERREKANELIEKVRAEIAGKIQENYQPD